MQDSPQITINDQWFNHYQEIIRNTVIPYQWKALNDQIDDIDASHAIENLKKAGRKIQAKKRKTDDSNSINISYALASQSSPPNPSCQTQNASKLSPHTESSPESTEDLQFNGFIFQDSDLYKWLEAVAYSLQSHWDKELFTQAQIAIQIISEAQEEDGYINSFFTLEQPEKRWKNLCDCHELYCAGHLFEAAAAYYKSTKERKILNVAEKFANLLVETFGPEEEKLHGYPGHEEVEIGLVKLYEVTENQAYLNLAKYFILQRGQSPNYFVKERQKKDFFEYYAKSKNTPVDLEYHQAHQTILEQEHATGHCVRALYLYQAMAEVAKYTEDKAMQKQCEILW